MKFNQILMNFVILIFHSISSNSMHSERSAPLMKNSMKFDRIWKCDLRMAHNSKSVRRVTLTAHCVHQSTPNPICERYLVQIRAHNALKCTCERFPGEVHFQFGLKMSVTFFVPPQNQRSKFPKIKDEGGVGI